MENRELQEASATTSENTSTPTSAPTSAPSSESGRSPKAEWEEHEFPDAPASAAKKRDKAKKANGQREALGDNKKVAAKAQKRVNGKAQKHANEEAQKQANEKEKESKKTKKRIFNIVICGATAPADGWIWSDFYAMCTVLMERWHDRDDGDGGDYFISCFDVAAYFEFLKTHKQTDVKFAPDASFTYEKSRFEQCSPFWTQVSPKRMNHEVENCIGKTVAHAQPGDTINLFLFCHGTAEGGLILGEGKMQETQIAKMLAKVEVEVITNTIVSACFSGALIKSIRLFGKNDRYVATAADEYVESFSLPRSASGRHRSSQFTTAVVDVFENYADLDDPTVAESEDYIRKEMARLCDKYNTSTPQFLHEKFDPLKTKMNDRVFPGLECAKKPASPPSDPAARPSDPPDSAPDSDPASQDSWANTSEDVGQTLSCSAKAIVPLPERLELVVRSECARCETYYSYPPDQTMYGEMLGPSPCWSDILANLYWRAFRQARVWYIFNVLLANGLVDFSALALPIDLRQSSPNTHRVCKLFFCFKVMQNERDFIVMRKIPLQSTSWIDDVRWLATLLIRSGSDIAKAIVVIKEDGCLGKFDQEIYEENLLLNPDLHDVTFDSHEREGKLLEDGEVDVHRNVLGFWLPHGLTTDPEISTKRLDACNKRCHDIESAWRQAMPSVKLIIIQLIEIQVEVSDDNDVAQIENAPTEAGAQMETTPIQAIPDEVSSNEA